MAEILPGLPQDSVQSKFTGSVGDTTLREGWDGYRLFRDLYMQYVGPVQPATRVLDFGCGWGRIIRFFHKEVEPGYLTGVDINEEVLQSCRETMPGVRFDRTTVMPPSPFEDNSVDLIYAYSIFSHPSREAHDRWLSEFERILVPGGLLIATTWQREFIERCERMRTDPELQTLPASHLTSARAFLDMDAGLALYDSGEYCFSHRGGDDAPDFGETCISEAFARREWSRWFDIVEFIDDRERCRQNVLAARKRAAGTSRGAVLGG